MLFLDKEEFAGGHDRVHALGVLHSVLRSAASYPVARLLHRLLGGKKMPVIEINMGEEKGKPLS